MKLRKRGIRRAGRGGGRRRIAIGSAVPSEAKAKKKKAEAAPAPRSA